MRWESVFRGVFRGELWSSGVRVEVQNVWVRQGEVFGGRG